MCLKVEEFDKLITTRWFFNKSLKIQDDCTSCPIIAATKMSVESPTISKQLVLTFWLIRGALWQIIVPTEQI